MIGLNGERRFEKGGCYEGEDDEVGMLFVKDDGQEE